MSEIDLTEDQVNKMSADIVAKMQEKKEVGLDLSDPETKAELEKMATEQVKLAQAKANIKRKGELEEEDFTSEEEQEKAYKAEFEEVDEMNQKDREQLQETKMLTSQSRLQLREGKSLGERIEEFKQLSDDAYLVMTMLNGAAKKKELPGASPLSVFRGTDIYKQIVNKFNDDKELRKALAVATSGSGAEWIPTGFSSQVLVKIELQLKTVALFNSIAMPTSPYTLPIQSSNAEGYLIPESTADEATKIKASTPGTGNATFTTRKIADRVLFSEEIDEDSIIAVRTFTLAEMAKAIARGHETAVVNGDRAGAAGSAASHQDNAGTALFTTDYDARLAFDGLRYFYLNQTDTSGKDFSNAVPSDSLMSAVRLLMGKHAVLPSDLVWLMSVNSYLQCIANLSNIQTLDKYGPMAAVLAGELFKYQGIPVVVSEYVFSNVNASGLYDGSTTDRSTIMLVYRPGFLNGTRGGVMLSTANDIETDQVIMVGKRRVDFIDPYDATATGNVQVAGGYNVKTT
jgi:HK97 family phage major capsid protein